MKNEDTVTLTGKLIIKINDDVVREVPNLVTTAGKGLIASRLASASDGVGGGYNFSGDTPSPEKVKTYKITYATDGMAYLPGANTTLGKFFSNLSLISISV